MTGQELAFVVVLVLIAVNWQAQLRARERATAAGRRACERAGVHFLDDTVALQRTRLRRGGRGGLLVVRRYRFEFATDGQVRYGGNVVLAGDRVTELWLDPEAFATPRAPIEGRVVPLRREIN